VAFEGPALEGRAFEGAALEGSALEARAFEGSAVTGALAEAAWEMTASSLETPSAGVADVAAAVTSEVPGDLVRMWLPWLPHSYKISPVGLRPREPESAPPPARRSPPQPARTTVRIEIGRIEIRAPQSPAPVTMPTPMSMPPRNETQQGLSLAEYLRGNDGRPR
jgi:hypothetical protein